MRTTSISIWQYTKRKLLYTYPFVLREIKRKVFFLSNSVVIKKKQKGNEQSNETKPTKQNKTKASYLGTGLKTIVTCLRSQLTTGTSRLRRNTSFLEAEVLSLEEKCTLLEG